MLSTIYGYNFNLEKNGNNNELVVSKKDSYESSHIGRSLQISFWIARLYF